MAFASKFTVLLIVVVLLVPSPASAGLIVTSIKAHADSHAAFNYLGTTFEQRQAVETASQASSQALAGYSTTPEARTAARAGPHDFAVNARLDGKIFFDSTVIEDNGSTAVYETNLLNIGGAAEHVSMTFFLPQIFVETTTNAELQFVHVSPAAFALIETQTVSVSGNVGQLVTHFSFGAFLDDTFRSSTSGYNVTAQPGLDVSPLRNPTFTDSGLSGFLRTRNLEFDPFVGDLDLGILNAGDSITVKYTMQARALGAAAFTVGIASINDPFFFDSDPVTAGAPYTISSLPVATPVPEPGTLALAASAALVVLARRGRRALHSLGWGRKQSA
jgi:PEP-CTERM motif